MLTKEIHRVQQAKQGVGRVSHCVPHTTPLTAALHLAQELRRKQVREKERKDKEEKEKERSREGRQVLDRFR